MRKFLFLFVSVVFFLVQSDLDAKNRTVNSDTSFSKIIGYLVEGDLKRAEKAASSLEKRLRRLNESGGKFLMGYMNYRLGRYDRAKDYFLKIQGDQIIINDYVKYFLGSSCLELGLLDCAVENLGALVNNDKSSVLYYDALWGLSRAYYASGNYSDAERVLGDLGPTDSKVVTPSGYEMLKARIAFKSGKVSEAAALLKKVYFDVESSEIQDEVVKLLREIGTAEAKDFLSYIKTVPAKIQLAEQMLRVYRFDDGVKLLEEIYSGSKDQHMTSVMADAYFMTRDYSKAKELYEKLVSSKGDRGSAHYLLRLAKSAARTNDFGTAINVYKRLLKSEKGPARSKYLYKLGFLYLDSRQYKDALKFFDELLESGYKGPLRRDLLWNAAWSHYKLGNYEDAIKFFEQLDTNAFGREWRVRSRYWVARCWEKSGSPHKANAIFTELINKDRFDYYGFRSADRVYKSLKIPGEWAVFNDLPMTEGDTFSLPAGLEKADYLFQLELRDLSAREVSRFNRKTLMTREDAISFIEFAKQVGDYRSAHLVAAERFKDLLSQYSKKDDLRRFIWDDWYPEAYGDEVMGLGKEFKVDPKIVYSIMREESRFQTDVVSRAGAIGLMQIIPPTAKKLAAELHHNPFSAMELYNPAANIRFGVKYLGDLSQLFDGEKVYMIASYNAGEDAVLRWIKSSDAAKDIEEFIEEIPYDETNNYVKRVLKSYWIYESLYR